MGRVAGVFDDPPGFPHAPPGVDVLEVTVSSSSAVSKPGGDVIELD